MIPIFQTRYAVETFGNCFEACIASILELPLAAVPDRAQFVDADKWADTVATAQRHGEDVGDLDLPTDYDRGELALREWLEERGLAWFDVVFEANGLTPAIWLDVAADGSLLHSYWIGHTRAAPSAPLHATVWHGAKLAHNPSRGDLRPYASLGPLTAVTLLIAGDPAKTARTLEPLPDVAGALAAA